LLRQAAVEVITSVVYLDEACFVLMVGDDRLGDKLGVYANHPTGGLGSRRWLQGTTWNSLLRRTYSRTDNRNSSHISDDGAALSVAATYYADRTSQIYNGSIRPDEIIFDLRSQGIGDPSKDPVIPAAVDWLLNQEACHLK
jgi:hypothetical protein